jgi:hypothetical protein
MHKSNNTHNVGVESAGEVILRHDWDLLRLAALCDLQRKHGQPLSTNGHQSLYGLLGISIGLSWCARLTVSMEASSVL